MAAFVFGFICDDPHLRSLKKQSLTDRTKEMSVQRGPEENSQSDRVDQTQNATISSKVCSDSVRFPLTG